MPKKIVIIGGGYGGLATAALLAKRGHSVTILEKNSQLGGRAGSIDQDGFRFDTGPSWYLMPEVFETFYALFSLDARQELEVIRLTPGYKVFFEDTDPIVIQGDVSKDAATFEAIEAGSGDKLLKYVAKSQKIYELSVQEILYTPFTSWKWLLHKNALGTLPAFMSMATRTLDQYVSKYFSDQRLKQILQYHSVFLGTSPYSAPAIYSLMSTLDFNSGVYYPKRGMYSLVESLVALGSSLGVIYETNTSVSQIIVNNGQAVGVELASGETLDADIVISNADLHHTETRLLDKEYQSYPEAYWEKKEPSPSAVLVSLGIRGSLPSLLHHNLFFVNDWEENFDAIYSSKSIPENASLYICKPSATDRTTAPEGSENIFILVPLPAHRLLSGNERDGIVSRAIDQLSVMANEPDITSRIITQHITEPLDFEQQFNAWAYNSLGGQSHLLTQSAFFRIRNKSKKVENLYYVGAGTNPGVGLPMCLISAQVVFKMIHDITHQGPLTDADMEPVK